MTAFLITEQEAAWLHESAVRALANPVPWDVLKQSLPANQDTDTLPLSDRRGPERPLTTEQIMLQFGWRVAISAEEQPAGVLLHVSMSSPARGRVPRPEAMIMVVDACGFKREQIARSWMEEYEPGKHAFNVLVLPGSSSE